MSKINDILNFSFPYISFVEKSKGIIPPSLKNLTQNRIATLEEITNKIGKKIIDDKPKGIREVYYKFRNLRQSNDILEGEFDKRELRTLSYALKYKEYHEFAIFENVNDFQIALSLFKVNWRDSYISGLLDCFLSSWDSRNSVCMDILGKLIFDKLSNYEGSRNRYLTLKSNIKFFDINKGDIDLGYTLAISKKPISEATKYLSFPDNWITYSYFSGVINGYYEKSKSEIAEKIDNIALTLEKHSNSTKGTNTNKIIISKIICQNSTNNQFLQDKIKDIAFKLIGDPGLKSMWRPFDGISDSDKITIEKAREILNEWVTRQFISVFFERCINDTRRKRFWLKYAKSITAFKVFGPSYIKSLLKEDQRISKYVDGRFQTVESNRDVSAFMFIAGDYKMIEFSDPGYAFYAYLNTNFKAPSFEKKNINSVDTFRDGSMPMLVYRSGYHLHSYSNEGRLSHNDGDMKWEDVFSSWLTKMARINV